jgi:hypothetical protein
MIQCSRFIFKTEWRNQQESPGAAQQENQECDFAEFIVAPTAQKTDLETANEEAHQQQRCNGNREEMDGARHSPQSGTSQPGHTGIVIT